MASWPTWRAGGAARVRSPAGRRAGVKCRPSPRNRSPLIDQVNFPSGQTSLFRSRMRGRAGLAVATFASSRRWRSAGAAAPERAEPDPAGPLPLGQQSPVIRNPDSMKNAYTGSRRAASPDGRGRRARRRPRRRGYRPRPAGDASRHGTRRSGRRGSSGDGQPGCTAGGSGRTAGLGRRGVTMAGSGGVPRFGSTCHRTTHGGGSEDPDPSPNARRVRRTLAAAGSRRPSRADPQLAPGRVLARGYAEPGDALEPEVEGAAAAALGGEVVEADRTAGVGDDRGPAVVGAEAHRAVDEPDPADVVQVPPVRRAG